MIDKIEVPSIQTLVKWHNHFARMLKPNTKRTKLFGVDSKRVEYTERSEPQVIRSSGALDDSLGYNHATRSDGSKSIFRLSGPDGHDKYLTYPETDLVLGTNYYAIDNGYSSPGPTIRRILFDAESSRAGRYNAFEIGCPITGGEEDTIPIIYYRIPKQRFMELRDWDINLDDLVGSVREERREGVGENGSRNT